MRRTRTGVAEIRLRGATPDKQQQSRIVEKIADLGGEVAALKRDQKSSDVVERRRRPAGRPISRLRYFAIGRIER